MTTEPDAQREDHTVDASLQHSTPLPPPRAAAPPPVTPTMPAARSNAMPHLAGTPTVVASSPQRQRSRTRFYTIAIAVFLAISVAGYLGFRAYIYGDDAPSVPVLDDLGG